MKNRIITISRECGSGGSMIGRRVAEKLGIPCYDAEAIQRIAQQSVLLATCAKETNRHLAGIFLACDLDNYIMSPANEHLLWTIRYNVITKLAEQGSCVIIGRCADFILKDKADCLNIFIHADPAYRVSRLICQYKTGQASAEHHMTQTDKRRAACYRFYTDMEWGDSKNYHLCIDSGSLGIDKCVELITLLY